MWVFLPFGFYSVVCDKTATGATEYDTVLVRGRVKRHMTVLVEEIGRLGQWKPSIVEHSGTDYRYRIVMLKTAWADVVQKLTMKIDYTNFKNEASDEVDKCGYVDALHQVWATMYELQPNRGAK